MRFLRNGWRTTLAAGFLLVGVVGVAVAALVGTTSNDFFQPGTQPSTLTDPIVTVSNCFFCHGGFDPDDEPWERWAGGMMANAMRDPVFHAALAITQQDAADSGELCLRCHSPGGWLEGRSAPTDGSAMFGKDYEGITCNFCHRMVDPYPDPANPPEDASILAGLTNPPDGAHTAQYIVDPLDRRRGPFDLLVFPHYWLKSPFHQDSLLCGTCHDVSNPAFTRIGGPIPSASDTYALNALDTPHPTQDRYDEMPVERTYSEWLMSDFAQGPIDMGGRYGGNKTDVGICQDCHMPDTTGSACAPPFGGVDRTDLPQHDFAGANSWVPAAVYDLDQSLILYGPAEASGVPLSVFQDAIARNVSLLQRASDLDVSWSVDRLRARITNEAGHKLPSGFPEGRRMWINVQFFDAQGSLIAERGHYDAATAVLTTDDTKVYEVELGLDAAVASATGLPEAPSFHFALNNKVYKDNRIPPRGYTFANFESIQAQPVGYAYPDGQHWDDTLFDIPCGAVRAEVRVFHQTTSKEYIEFLRDTNVTNNAGQIAYDEWVANGRSAPVEMDLATIALTPRLTADVDSISVSAGGTQTMCIAAGPAHAGELYWVLGSITGTSPGTPLGGIVVPLNLDVYFLLSLNGANQPPFGNTVGFLDAQGNATATFDLPPGSNPTLAGLHADHAYGVIHLTTPLEVSNPLGLDLTP